jgi:hypothetical protein
MLYRQLLVAGVIACFGLVPAAGQEKGKRPDLPKGQSPRFFFVTKVEKDQFEVSEVVPPPGGEVASAGRSFRPKFDQVRAFDAKRQKLTPEQLRDRIKVGVVVLLAVDEHPIAPAYLKAVVPDTVILEEVVVRVEAGPPAKPQPKPDK